MAYGVKVEDRIRIRRGLKARVSGGVVTCQTRMGRETAVGSNGEIKCAALAPIPGTTLGDLAGLRHK